VAIVGEQGEILQRPVSVQEEAAVYDRLRALLGAPQDCTIAMEATGHYWKNLFARLTAEGFSIALINPVRTLRFAEEELRRTETDHVDALAIARFAAHKRLKPTKLSGTIRTKAAGAGAFAQRYDPASRRPYPPSTQGNRSNLFRVHAERTRARHGTRDDHSGSISNCVFIPEGQDRTTRRSVLRRTASRWRSASARVDKSRQGICRQRSNRHLRDASPLRRLQDRTCRGWQLSLAL
jgi:hypothetical protein